MYFSTEKRFLGLEFDEFPKISYFFYKPESSEMSIMNCLVRSAQNMLVIILTF